SKREVAGVLWGGGGGGGGGGAPAPPAPAPPPTPAAAAAPPEDYMGDVMGDLNRRRGMIQGMEDTVSGKVIRAEVPLGEMFGYATDVRSMSQGRASYSMEFKKYDTAPSHIVESVTKKQG
ncbi:hypothetical protein ACIOVA_27400, partial [Pseudomonas iridis]